MNVQFAGVGESSYLVRRVYVQGVLEPPARDALVDFSSGGHARLAEEYVPVALDAPTAVVARPRRAREGAVVVAFERRRQLRLRHPEVNVRAPGRLFNEAKRSLEELAAPPPNRQPRREELRVPVVARPLRLHIGETQVPGHGAGSVGGVRSRAEVRLRRETSAPTKIRITVSSMNAASRVMTWGLASALATRQPRSRPCQ